MYIYLKDSQLFLMMRIISGDIISRDNTCKTYAALRDCIEEAPRAIEANIAIYEHLAGNPKIDNILTQLYTYQELLHIVTQHLQTVDIDSDNYSPTIPTGAHTITLASQTNPDNFLTQQTPTFSLRHSRIEDMQHDSWFGSCLRSAIATLDTSNIHGFSTDLSRYKQAIKPLKIETQLDDSAILETLEQIWKAQQYPSALWTTSTQQGGDTISVKNVLEKRLTAIRELGESESHLDTEQLIGALPVGLDTDTHPFILERCMIDIIITLDHAPKTMVDKISVLIQFYLAIINVACKEQDPHTDNLGMILEDNRALSTELIQTMVTSIQQHIPLDQCILEFLKTRHIIHDIDHQTVIDLFEKTYMVVRDQEHMDQHTIRSLRSDSPYVHYADAFCVELSSWIKQLSPIYNTDPDFFDKKIDALQAHTLPGNVIEYGGSDLIAPIQALIDYHHPPQTIFALMTQYDISHVSLYKALHERDERAIDPDACWIYACENDHIPLMEFLLSHQLYPHTDCTIDCVDEADNHISKPILSYLIENNLLAISTALIPHSNLSAIDNEHNTPLMYACYTGQEATIRQLLKQGCDIHAKNKQQQTALVIAVSNGHFSIAKHLVEHGASLIEVDDQQYSTLEYAIIKQHDTISTWIVTELIQNGHLPIAQIKSHLHHAIRHHLPQLFHHLLPLYNQYHFRPITSTKDPLVIEAAQYNRVVILKQLIELGHDTTMALHVAAQYGHSEAVKLLIPYAKDINASYGENTLPIQLAFQNNHLAICADLILSGKLETHFKEILTHTIHYALQHGRLDFIRFLCQYGKQHIDTYLTPNLSALLIATQYNQRDIVKYLYSLPTPQQSPTHSPFIIAARANNLPMLKACYTYDQELEQTDHHGYSALYHAIKADSADALQWLLEHGADYQARHPRYRSALLFSTRYNAINAFHLLLQHHQDHGVTVDLNELDHSGYSMVMYAAKHPTSTIMPSLLRCGASPDNALVIAAKYGNYPAARCLLEHGANPNETWNHSTPLAQAIKHNHLSIIALLLQDPRLIIAHDDIQRITTLHDLYNQACATGHIKLVKALLDTQRLAPNQPLFDNQSPLMIAAENGQQPLVEYLCSNYPETINWQSANHHTALAVAIKNQRYNSVVTLLWFGAAVNDALTIATEVDYGDIIPILIRHGATTAIDDILHFAVQERHQSAISAWLYCGIAVDKLDALGNTALFYATTNRDTEAMAALLDHGANPNSLNNGLHSEYNELDLDSDQPITPLMIAACYGEQETVIQLLDAGACPNLTTEKGTTALQYAVEHNHISIVEALLSYGAKPSKTPDILSQVKDNPDMMYTLLIHGAALPEPSQTAAYENCLSQLSSLSHWTTNHAYIIEASARFDEDLEHPDPAAYWDIGMLAVLYQKTDIIAQILEQIEDPEAWLQHLLLHAIQHQKGAMVSHLLSLDTDLQDLTTEGMTLMEYAISQDAENMLPYLNPVASNLSQFGIANSPSQQSLNSSSDGHTTTEANISSSSNSPTPSEEEGLCLSI